MSLLLFADVYSLVFSDENVSNTTQMRVYAPDHGEREITIVAADEDSEFCIYALDIVRFFVSLHCRLPPSLASFDVWQAGVGMGLR